MTLRLGVVMDPISSITVKKDTTLAMLIAAQKRGWQLHYFEQRHLFLKDRRPQAQSRLLTVRDDPKDWYSFGDTQDVFLGDLDIILMRKDPPFNMEYIYTTYLLELAESEGALVVNRPQSLRDANEKLFTLQFPDCCPPTLVSREMARIKNFLQEHKDIIVKLPDGMGGASVFRLRENDPNISVVLETLTQHDRHMVLAQRYLPEIVAGDKRILMINGIPIPYALARMPAPGETRANLAAGGQGIGRPLSDRERWICSQVGPTLQKKGLYFVGLDVIGDYLTEINVTSPTCIRELDAQYDIDIGGQLMDFLAQQITD